MALEKVHMMSKENSWFNNWSVFVAQLIELLDSGASDSEISAKYRDQSVTWEGTITSIDLDEEYVPGISMSMGLREVMMANGRFLDADHVALLIEGDWADSWRNCKEGQRVRFSAIIPISETTRPEINFSQFENDPLVGLMLGLKNCKKLANVE